MANKVFNKLIKTPVCERGCIDGYQVDTHDNIQQDANGKDIRCQCYFEGKYLESNIGFSYWPLTPQTFDGHPKDLLNIKKHMKDAFNKLKTGQGIYIHGANGAGKTSLAMMFLKYVLHYSQCSTLFAPWSDLVILNSRIISGFHDAQAENDINIIKNVDFLVIDDIGKEFDDGKDKARATLNSLIRYRDLWNKPTIYTGNTPIEDLKHYGHSNYSIMEGRSEIISMEYDRDYRKEKKMEGKING